jgi:hypothetical protein
MERSAISERSMTFVTPSQEHNLGQLKGQMMLVAGFECFRTDQHR